MEENDFGAAGLDIPDIDPVQQEPVQEPVTAPADPPPVTTSESDDTALIREYLQTQGIKDMNSIAFDNGNGGEARRSWNSLSKEEKLGILGLSNAIVETSDDNYSQEEIDLIQQIRDSRQSPSEYLQSLQDKAAQQVKDESYNIDDLTDDQLYLYDLIDKYGNENVTDEELDSLLNNAKSNPELYRKTVIALRAEYKKQEDDLRISEQQAKEQQKEAQYDGFKSTILNEIESLSDIGGLEIELSVDEMNDFANFVLTRDEEGNSEFGRLMDNPKVFTQAALWIYKGRDIMNEISSQIKLAYEKGLAAGKQGQSKLAFGNPKDRTKPLAFDGISAAALDVN